MSRSVSRRWRRRSRRELTDAVAAACFSLSSATDAMGAARWPSLATETAAASGFECTRVGIYEDPRMERKFQWLRVW